MVQLDSQRIKKLQTGERVGNIAIAFCAVATAAFITLFTLSEAFKNELLYVLAFSLAIPLIVLGAGVSAFCNFKFGVAIDRAVRAYVQDVFVENAAKIHPERKSLSFFVRLDGCRVILTVNSYNDEIVFDFSAFGKKLSAARKAAVLNAVDIRLTSAFCKLYERGADYVSVDYREKDGLRRKSGKTVPIITDGKPEVRAMKLYLKNK